MPKYLETPKGIALLAGGLCYFFAFSVLVQIPSCVTDADVPRVVGIDGVARDVKPYTAVEQQGRDLYGKNICWHCHSDFVRPVNGEEYRWGPVSQAGEYAWDLPHFFGTRRTGPDLHREGGLRSDDWHYAHFFDPRFTVPRSVMEGFTWFFRDFNPQSLADFNAALFSEHSGHLRMVVTYWDMAAALVNDGAISFQLFHDCNGEHIGVFSKIEPLLDQIRGNLSPRFAANNADCRDSPG